MVSFSFRSGGETMPNHQGIGFYMVVHGLVAYVSFCNMICGGGYPMLDSLKYSLYFFPQTKIGWLKLQWILNDLKTANRTVQRNIYLF